MAQSPRGLRAGIENCSKTFDSVVWGRWKVVLKEERKGIYISIRAVEIENVELRACILEREKYLFI